MSKVENAVAAKLLKRAEAGLAKYGVTMERTDLSRLDWLIHAQEEAMDLAVYLERLIQDEREDTSHIKVGDIVSVRNDKGCAKRGDIGVVSKVLHNVDGQYKILYQIKCPDIEFFMDGENLQHASSKV
ncbi:holin [Siphoviridae environmental samples]|nr:holin [Siphoviridae environmental samples]